MIGGIVLAGIGSQRSNSFLIGCGVILLGTGLLVGGAKILFRDNIDFWRYKEILMWLRGISFWVWGVIWILGGIWAFVIGLVVLLRKVDLAQAYIFRRPGILILSVGIAIFGKGISNMFEHGGERSSTLDILRRLPRRIGGFMLLLLSIMLIGLGLFEIFAPVKYDIFFSAVLSP